MTETAHDLLTIPGDDGRPQCNSCRRCGANTLGPWLPELPCLVPDADLATRRQRDHESEDSEGARDE